MDLVLNNLQRLICHKTQKNKQTNRKLTRSNMMIIVMMMDCDNLSLLLSQIKYLIHFKWKLHLVQPESRQLNIRVFMFVVIYKILVNGLKFSAFLILTFKELKLRLASTLVINIIHIHGSSSKDVSSILTF